MVNWWIMGFGTFPLVVLITGTIVGTVHRRLGGRTFLDDPEPPVFTFDEPEDRALAALEDDYANDRITLAELDQRAGEVLDPKPPRVPRVFTPPILRRRTAAQHLHPTGIRPATAQGVYDPIYYAASSYSTWPGGVTGATGPGRPVEEVEVVDGTGDVRLRVYKPLRTAGPTGAHYHRDGKCVTCGAAPGEPHRL